MRLRWARSRKLLASRVLRRRPLPQHGQDRFLSHPGLLNQIKTRPAVLSTTTAHAQPRKRPYQKKLPATKRLLGSAGRRAREMGPGISAAQPVILGLVHRGLRAIRLDRALPVAVQPMRARMEAMALAVVMQMIKKEILGHHASVARSLLQTMASTLHPIVTRSCPANSRRPAA